MIEGIHPAPPIHVVGLSGSLRPGSYTRMAVNLALQGAAEVGAQIELLDLRDFDLSFCTGKSGDTPPSNDVVRLRHAVRRAEGIILGTPEYHSSFSGVLKNALDVMGFDEFEGKMIGLVGVSAGAMGGINALTGLQAVGRALHAWVIPDQAAIPQAWKVFTPEGTITDPELAKRVNHVGRQVARFAYLHSSHRAFEFVQQWEEAPSNPGGVEPVILETIPAPNQPEI